MHLKRVTETETSNTIQFIRLVIKDNWLITCTPASIYSSDTLLCQARYLCKYVFKHKLNPTTICIFPGSGTNIYHKIADANFND